MDRSSFDVIPIMPVLYIKSATRVEFYSCSILFAILWRVKKDCVSERRNPKLVTRTEYASSNPNQERNNNTFPDATDDTTTD